MLRPRSASISDNLRPSSARSSSSHGPGGGGPCCVSSEADGGARRRAVALGRRHHAFEHRATQSCKGSNIQTIMHSTIRSSDCSNIQPFGHSVIRPFGHPNIQPFKHSNSNHSNIQISTIPTCRTGNTAAAAVALHPAGHAGALPRGAGPGHSRASNSMLTEYGACRSR